MAGGMPRVRFPKPAVRWMTTQAIELFRSVPRYLAARAVGDRVPGLLAGPLAPMRFVNRKDVVPLGPGWGRVRPLLSGICGSDLATISGQVVVLLLAAGVAAVRPRPRGGRRAPRRRRRPPAGHPGRARTRPELPRPRPRPVRQLRDRPQRPLRPGHHRPRERRPADRLLRRHRRRLEQDVRRAPLAAPPRARRALGIQGGPGRTALLRRPHRPAREPRAQRERRRHRRRHRRHPHAPRAQGAHEGRPRHRRRQARRSSASGRARSARPRSSTPRRRPTRSAEPPAR